MIRGSLNVMIIQERITLTNGYNWITWTSLRSHYLYTDVEGEHELPICIHYQSEMIIPKFTKLSNLIAF